MKRLLPLFAAVAGLASAQSAKTVVDNDQVKVLSVTVQPHQKTRMHDHKVNRVMIYLQAGKQHFDFEDGKKADLNWKAGQVLWSPAAGNHVAEITSAQPVTIVEIELKKPAGKAIDAGPMDPVKVDPKRYKVEFENDQVRVLRVKVEGKGKIAMHEHARTRVLTAITSEDFRITTSDGKVITPKLNPGDVTFSTPVKHHEENMADQPFEAVIVELKS